MLEAEKAQRDLVVDFAECAPDDSAALEKARILLVGSGNLASIAGWMLAGVGRLEIVDSGRFTPRTAGRHVCGPAAAGECKAAAVAQFLAERFPALDVRGHELFCLNHIELQKLLCRADICLVTADDESLKYRVGDLCYGQGKPAVFTRVCGDGSNGEVILVDPPLRTPCYSCAARSLRRPVVPTIHRPGNVGSVPARSGFSIGPWTDADLTSVVPTAAVAAQVVLGRLAAVPSFEFSPDGTPASRTTAWLLPFRRVPPLKLLPWRLKPMPLVRQQDCCVCGPQREAISAGAAPVIDLRKVA